MLPMMFETGDEVFSPDYGWGKVTNIREGGMYPVAASFKNTNSNLYTMEGKRTEFSAAPTLFPSHLVPQYYLDLCPRPKRRVVKTLERWVNLYPHGAAYTYNTLEDAERNIASISECGPIKLTGTYEVEE
jgi:hypothetical protein